MASVLLLVWRLFVHRLLLVMQLPSSEMQQAWCCSQPLHFQQAVLCLGLHLATRGHELAVRHSSVVQNH